jgi:pimeloyl-ACP methyl ester carboxylesterase
MPSSGSPSVDELRFRTSGEGEPVLFVPGFPFGPHVFRQLIPLAEGRFRTVVVDVDRPAGAREQAAALRSTLERLQIERCAVIAHGTGGRVAQALAFGDAGAVIDAMVLLASPGPTGAIALPADPDEALALAHAEPLGREDADAYLDGWRHDPDAYARARAAFEAGEGVPGLDDAMVAWDRPVLILHGEEDGIVEPAVAERLNAAIPASTLGFVPESGHLLLDDAFASIGTMIVEYLRARYLRAPHDHGGITMLQLERRPPSLDRGPEVADDEVEPVLPDPAEQEVGPNP